MHLFGGMQIRNELFFQILTKLVNIFLLSFSDHLRAMQNKIITKYSYRFARVQTQHYIPFVINFVRMFFLLQIRHIENQNSNVIIYFQVNKSVKNIRRELILMCVFFTIMNKNLSDHIIVVVLS